MNNGKANPLSPDRRYVRGASVAALSREKSVVFALPQGQVVVVQPIDVLWLSEVLERSALPISGAELLRDASPEEERVLHHLVARGILAEATQDYPPAPSGPAGEKVCGRLLVGISGAVQAIHTPAFVLPLLHHFCERMDLIFTDAAAKFVVPEAFEYFGIGVWKDPFEKGGQVPHMELARSADLVLIAPASAATLHRLASGACSDLLSLVVAATEAPVVVAPAMNGAMWRKPAIRRNVAQLRKDGVIVVEPSVGFEVSSQDPLKLEQGGMGLSPANVVSALTSVLALSRTGSNPARTLPQRKPGRRAAQPSR
jgi:3-polyprenyl-4-hydroxybenzoate decarboxylase